MRYTRILSRIFILSIMPFVLFAQADETEKYIERGDYYKMKYDNLKALEYYEAAYNNDPDNYEAVLKIVEAYNDTGDEFMEQRNKDEAEKYIMRGVELAEEFQSKFPDSAAVYAYLAFSYGNLALFVGGNEKVKLAKKIEANAKKSIAMDEDHYLPYIILGIYYRELADLSWLERAFANTFFGGIPEGSFEDSEKMLKKALAIEPEMVIAVYQLSKTYRHMDLESKEKEMLKKTLNYPKRNFRDRYAKIKAQRRLEQLE